MRRQRDDAGHAAARSMARIDRTPDMVPNPNAASHCPSSISSK
jgi:hypothetical protein